MDHASLVAGTKCEAMLSGLSFRTRFATIVPNTQIQEMVMGRITFQKRQKEMKRQEKQRMKAERRAQKKLAKNTEGGAPTGTMENIESMESVETVPVPTDSEP